MEDQSRAVKDQRFRSGITKESNNQQSQPIVVIVVIVRRRRFLSFRRRPSYVIPYNDHHHRRVITTDEFLDANPRCMYVCGHREEGGPMVMGCAKRQSSSVDCRRRDRKLWKMLKVIASVRN